MEMLSLLFEEERELELFANEVDVKDAQSQSQSQSRQLLELKCLAWGESGDIHAKGYASHARTLFASPSLHRVVGVHPSAPHGQYLNNVQINDSLIPIYFVNLEYKLIL